MTATSSPRDAGGGREGGPSGAFAVTRVGKRFELAVGGASGWLRAFSLAKEPSTDPNVKRHAVKIEKPSEGERWDEGTWRFVEKDGFSSPETSIDQGKLHAVFEGARLQGEFVLVDTEKGWFFYKTKEKEEKLPAWIEPMLPSTRDEPTREEGTWWNELKLDGIRVIAMKEKGAVQLFSRRGNSLERQFPEVVREIAALPAATLAIDGEICILDSEGRARFQLIQPRIHVASDAAAEKLAREQPSVCFAFDLLHRDGHDLRRLPLSARKGELKALLPKEGVALRYLEHIEGQADEFFALVATRGVEGIVQKRADSPYVSGRSTHWWKVKCGADADFVIGGYCLYESTSKGGLGGLLLGLYREGKLLYVGGVGTGWGDKERKTLRRLLAEYERKETPFANWTGLNTFSRGKKPEKIVWLEPVLVARCHYAEFTDDGKVIRCSYERLEERDAEGVKWPSDAPSPEGPPPSDAREARLPKLTNPDKVFFPEKGYTKGDLFDYYRKIAPLVLPHLRDRPMVLRRMPEGIHGHDFYQKNQRGKGAPEWLRTVVLSHESRDVRYAVVDDLGALLYCIQLGCISLSPWSSRLGSLENPDFSIIDLDPGEECTFDQVVECALLVREILDELGLRGYPKTSGATGMHVLIPLETLYTYEQSRILAELVATIAESRRKDLCTLVRAVKPRPKDKIYVDYLQNAWGKHVVGPYSVREVPEASISTPLKWDEVRRGLRPEQFDITNFEARAARVGDLYRAVLEDKQTLERVLEKR